MSLTEKDLEKKTVSSGPILDVSDNEVSSSHDDKSSSNQPRKTQRRLEQRHVNLIAIGGAIGTGLFITIGSNGLVQGGPLGLLLGYTFWTFIILCLTVSAGEMVCYLPVDSPFLTMAGRVVDPAFECAATVNFWLVESLYIPFEITAVNGMIHFWRDDYSPGITLAIQIVIYILINVFAVSLYGEVEFWLSISKLIMCIGLLIFTLVTMCGGNPQHDAFGFRHWHAAGGPIAEYIHTGSLGRFQGFLQGLFSACFTVVSSEYLSMTAGEAKNPRHNMAKAFKTVLYRLVVFFIGGALSVSILIAYNDPTYLKALGTGSNSSTAASSPYVVAMQNLHIKVLPHIVNGVVLSSAFSAGNSYTYCSSRTLYGLAQKGFAPKFLTFCLNNGVPIFCVAISSCFSLLSLLQISKSGANALDIMVGLCTGSQLLNYAFMSVTYLCFYRACKAQGIDRKSFTYTSYCQPYTGMIACFFLWCLVGILGYETLMPGRWDVKTFLYKYVMIFVSAAVFIAWKLIKRSKFVKPAEADLTTGLDEIEEHEYQYYAELEANQQQRNLKDKILDWLF